MQNIDLNSYAYGNSFQDISGLNTAEALAELNKSLVAGDITGGASVNQVTPGSGAPLKVESLDRQMKLLTFNETFLRLWQLIPKSAAYNTVEEFNQLASYGTPYGGALNEGQLGEEEDSTFVRRSEKIKYYGEVGSVSHPMQLVRSFDGQAALQRETKNRIMNLLRKMNLALAFGNEKIVGQEVNGIYRQHEIGIGRVDGFSDNPLSYYSSPYVVDLKGGTLTQSVIESAGTVIMQDGFGAATHIFGTPGVFSNFAKDFYSTQRNFPTPGNFNVGTQGINTSYPRDVTMSFGNVKLEHDIFLAKKSKGIASGTAQTSVKAPNAPTPGAASVPVADANSQFLADYAGDYRWAVRAKNLYGLSALTELDAGAAVTITATDAADLSFTDAGGANPATGYVIYRTEDNGTTYFPIFEVSTAELSAGYNGAGNGLVRDRNFSIPNTEDAVMTDLPNTLEIKQLAPLMKLDLATLAPATRFMVLSYWLLFLYAPQKLIRFTNCKHISD